MSQFKWGSSDFIVSYHILLVKGNTNVELETKIEMNLNHSKEKKMGFPVRIFLNKMKKID